MIWMVIRVGVLHACALSSRGGGPGGAARALVGAGFDVSLKSESTQESHL